MACIDNYSYNIILKGSFKECAKYIKDNYKSIRELQAGDEVIEGVMLIGKPPIPVAYEEDYIIFPYTKPCHGSYVLKVPLEEYIESETKNKKNKKEEENSDSKNKSMISKLKFW
ncbi:Uncharacterised conserved protein UCP006577 [Methanococcus aeolicus Nankai-3]|uniref:Uncharacterized conserved protein UCP006577 n=1 Tax=Methanococcus aeolicus (strain ATCC BAA-1280 / DSM 17508 / OCM 812 / Nankai-3) TaxID=419665 RepID=A6UVE0_META3|nr:DUF1894 domain-containing protein [Methanococcus aeolicus]ABR56462.1 Uncharacterised conserved protein UCP006577 [Methanococcus aeolicus Nankai-3]